MKPIRHKFNAKRTEVDEKTFASKKEANYYLALKDKQRRGEILFFLEQVPIRLPGGIKYIVDFIEFHCDDTVHFTDIKGMRTPVFILKKKLCEETYPFKIEEV